MLIRLFLLAAVALACAPHSSALSQSGVNVDSLRVVVAENVCEQMGEVDVARLSVIELQSKVGIVLIGELRKIPDAERVFGVDFTDPASMRTAGELIDMRMGAICPALFERFIVDNLEQEAGVAAVVARRLGPIGGTFPTEIKVGTEDGSTLVLLWLETFEGVELVLDEDTPELEYEYEEVDWFDSRKGSYVTRRVIREVRSTN